MEKRMESRIYKSVCMVTILLFLFSVITQTMGPQGEEQGLSSVIHQIQQLQKVPEKSSIDFRIIFASVITTLQAAAGLKKVVTIASTTLDPEPEQTQLVVTVRLPYLLPPDFVFHFAGIAKQLPAITWESLYKSHILNPEFPPPTTSFS